MPTYFYETTDGKVPARRFELKQRFGDAVLFVDPDSGRGLRRLITGGLIVSGSYIGPSVGSCG